MDHEQAVLSRMARRRRQAQPGPYLLHAELLKDRNCDRERFPFSLPAFRSLDLLPFHPKVTFLIGENGTGKSTLLEAVALLSGLNPEGGSRNFNFATRESHSNLDGCLRLARTAAYCADSYFLRAESYYNVATEIERLDREPGGSPPLIHAYGGRSLHEQSHGESFFALFVNRLGGPGLYLMDEPEAALSPSRQLQFLALLHERCTAGSQFIIATHSPIIMAYPDAWIYRLDDNGITRVPYDETEHFLVTRGFLANPRRSLAVLMADEPTMDTTADERATD